MLKEIPKEKLARLNKDENCRWFRDDYFDLFLWNEGERIISFQLCYDIYGNQKALEWHEGKDILHYTVDDGENRPGKPKAIPVLTQSSGYGTNLAVRFKENTMNNDSDIFLFVYEKLIPLR